MQCTIKGCPVGETKRCARVFMGKAWWENEACMNCEPLRHSIWQYFVSCYFMFVYLAALHVGLKH